MRRALSAHELSDPKLPRKAPAELIAVVTVPQTDSGGREEHSKGGEARPQGLVERLEEIMQA